MRLTALSGNSFGGAEESGGCSLRFFAKHPGFLVLKVGFALLKFFAIPSHLQIERFDFGFARHAALLERVKGI